VKFTVAGLVAWLCAAVFAIAQDADAAARQVSARATIERWSDSLLIDRPREVLEEAARHASDEAWNGEALALVARAAFVARGRAEAEQWLARTPVAPETRSYLELERVRIELESDELARAIGLLFADPADRAPKLAPYPSAWLYAGRAWTRLGEAQRGAPFFARFVELAPLDVEAPSALHALAQEALARGDGAAAMAYVKRAEESAKWQSYRRVRVLQVREQPDEPLPRLGLAQLWLQARQPDRAQAALNDLLARHPQFAAGWFLLGETARMRSDLDAAFEAYSKTIEFEPTHVLALHNRATIARLKGRDAEARADLEAIVDGPHAAEKTALGSHLALARVLAAAGETEAADRRYARYRELGGVEALQP